MKSNILRSLSATAALLAAVSAGAAVKVGTPTIDGTGINTTNYDLIALQTNTTNGFGAGNIAAGLYMAQDASSLYIGIAGNLSGNSYYIFLDTKAGGATNVDADPSPGYGEFNDLATGANGIMPSGFLADYVITVKTSTDLGVWDVQANTAGYRGNSGAPNAGYAMSINNTNAVTAPPYSGVSTGLELRIPKADIGTPTGNIGVFLILGNDNKAGNPATYMSGMTLPNNNANLNNGNYGNDGTGGGGGNGLNYAGAGGPSIVFPTPQLPVSVSGFGIE